MNEIEEKLERTLKLLKSLFNILSDLGWSMDQVNLVAKNKDYDFFKRIYDLELELATIIEEEDDPSATTEGIMRDIMGRLADPEFVFDPNKPDEIIDGLYKKLGDKNKPDDEDANDWETIFGED